MRPVLAPVPALALALLLPFAAGGEGVPVPPAPIPATDFDRALEAVTRGEILRLADILPMVEEEFGGRAIETELETEDGRWVYEIEILTAEGRLFEVDVDAVTGERLKVEEEFD